MSNVPIHSFADAQFALHRTPTAAPLELTWSRDRERISATIDLPNGWKRTDISWRASLRWRYAPSLPLGGDDLSAEERHSLGLSPTQLAFRQRDRLKTYARDAGFEPGDVIIAIDDTSPEMTAEALRGHVRKQYLVDDTVTFTILRQGTRLKIPLTLRNQ